MKRFAQGASERAAPRFDVDVPENGYRWWYVDGVSSDGRHGIVIIAFVGSVFSPYYFRARQGTRIAPEEHCAINVALYDKRVGRWCMTEHSAASLDRGADSFAVAKSHLRWDGDALHVTIHERSVPWLRRVSGEVILRPRTVNHRCFTPDSNARHVWQPIAPVADIEVSMSSPAWQWSGSGYFDTNGGSEPLEAGFRRWSWSRGASDTDCRIVYAVEQRDGKQRFTSLRFDDAGGVKEEELPPRIDLEHGLWRVTRHAYADRWPNAVNDLEDTPFYTRSLIDYGERHDMHEFLDLDRFQSNWVRLLLPFRMPRRR
ncbi:MAG: carotenoid 1,2-hydratase [Pseudomonadota bacterium]